MSLTAATPGCSSSTSSQAVVDLWPDKQIAKQTWIYVGSMILAIGTVGHVMSVLVLLGSRRMRRLSLTVYLAATSLAGLMALYLGLLRQILLHSNEGLDVRGVTSETGCKTHTVLTYFSLQFYSWLQASVAVERVIAVCRPLQYRNWCTWRRNIIVVVTIAAVLALSNVVLGVTFGYEADGQCYSLEVKFFVEVWGNIDLVLFSIFPIAVIIPCNVLTFVTVHRSNVNRQNSKRVSIRRSRQLTVMLLVHNIVCVVTTLPISVIFLVPWPVNAQSREWYEIELVWTVSSLFQYFGTTFGFVVYSLAAEKFRKAIRDLFFKGFNAKINSLNSFDSASTKSSRQSDSGNGMRLRLHSAPSSPCSDNTVRVELEQELIGA